MTEQELEREAGAAALDAIASADQYGYELRGNLMEFGQPVCTEIAKVSARAVLSRLKELGFERIVKIERTATSGR